MSMAMALSSRNETYKSSNTARYKHTDFDKSSFFDCFLAHPLKTSNYFQFLKDINRKRALIIRGMKKKIGETVDEFDKRAFTEIKAQLYPELVSKTCMIYTTDYQYTPLEQRTKSAETSVSDTGDVAKEKRGKKDKRKYIKDEDKSDGVKQTTARIKKTQSESSQKRKEKITQNRKSSV